MKKRFTKLIAVVFVLLMSLTIALISEFASVVLTAYAQDTYKTTVKVYSDAKIVENTTQYRYRIKAHQISSATSIAGWNQISQADPLYGSWSGEKSTTTQPTKSDVLEITRTESATRYRYYHYVGKKNGTTYWHFCPQQGVYYNSGVSYAKAYTGWYASNNRLSGSTFSQGHNSGIGGATSSVSCSYCGLKAGQKPKVYYVGSTPYYAEESNTYTAKWYYKTRTKTLRYNYTQYTDFSPWSYTEVTSLDELTFERQDGVDYTLETESRPVAIDEYGVIYSEDLTKIYFVPAELQTESFNIPATVTEICDYAFYNCASIKDIVIPSSVTKIGSNAFENCTALESIIIPENTTTIGNNAFTNCSSLGSVFFKSEVPVTLGSSCFTNTGIECFYVYFLEFKDAWLPYESSWNGYPLRGYNPLGELYSNIDDNGTDRQGFTYTLNESNKTATITAYSGGANVVFPRRVIKDSVEYPVISFTANAFKGKTNIIKVSMTKLITAIPANAFDGCTNLSEITYNGSFSSIGEYAFRNCSNLKKFDYLNGLTSIEKGAFYNCSKLTNVTIPRSVASIGESAFYGCAEIGNLVIPSSVTSVAANAFNGCKGITMVTFEGSPNLGANTFSNCTALATAKFKSNPSSSVESGAFGGTSEFFVQYPGNNNTWKSQVSNYKWKGYSAYSSDIISKIGGGGKTRPFIIKVVNYKGTVMKGATVTVNGTSQTVPTDGLVYFAMPSGSTANISINPNNSNFAQFSESSYKINKRTAVEYITVNANHSISGVSFNGKSISISPVSINRRYIEESSTVVVNVSSPLKIIKVELCANNKVIKTKNNVKNGNVTFGDINNGDFIANKNVTVKMVTEDGRTTTKKLNIVVFDGAKFELEFELGNGSKPGDTDNKPSGELNLSGSGWDFLRGMNIKIDIKKWIKEAKVSRVNGEDSIIYTINMAPFGTNYKDKDIKSVLKKSVTDGKFSRGTRGGFGGVIEMGYNPNTQQLYLKHWEVYAFANVEFGWGWTYKIPTPLVFLPVIPVRIDFSIKGQAQLGVKVYVNVNFSSGKTNNTLDFFGTINLDFSAYAGVGGKDISAGIYGKLGFEWQLWNKLFASGSFGVYAKAFAFKAEHRIAYFKDAQLLGPKSRSSLPTYRSVNSIVFDVDQFEPIERDYLETRSDWLSVENTRVFAKARNANIENTSNLSILQTSVYDYVEPKIITCNGTTIMVYADDIVGRGQNNLQALVYSIYNPVTGVWSAPQKIDNNDTFDNNFELYSYGTDIYVVYNEANKTFGDNADLEEISASTDISIARYDTVTGKIDNVESINNDNIYDMMPAFNVVDSIPTVVWTRNIENNVFGMDNSNEIVYSQYINGAWTEPSVLVSKMPWITSVAVGELNGKAYVAATSDADNNADTQDDNKLVLIDFVGSIKEVETGINNNANVQFVSFKGTETLIWCNAGQVDSLADGMVAPTSLISYEDFAIGSDFGWVDCNNGKYAVTFVSANGEEGSNVYTIYYNGSEWTNPIKVTNTDKYVGAYDVAYTNDQFVIPYRDTTVTFSETEDTFSTDSNLCVAYVAPVSDVYVIDAILDRNTLAFGEETGIMLSIFNNGFNDIENARITMKNSMGDTIFTTIESVQLASGESTDVGLFFTAPTAVEEGLYQIIVEDADGLNTADLKVYEIDLWQSDLCVEAEQLIIGEENSLIVNITNDGFIASATGKLNVANGTYNSEAEAFASIDIGSIEPGATETYLVELNDDIYADIETSGLVTAWVVTEGIDAVETNDYSTVAIVRLENEEGYDETEVVRFAPELSSDIIDVDLAYPQDAQIMIKENSNEFSSVKDLTEGSEYTYSEGVLTFKQAYLSELEEGISSIELVFNEGFDNKYTVTVIINVKDSTLTPITGVVTIDGEPVYGNTLSVNVDNIEPYTENYKVEWKRNGTVVSTDLSYVIGAEDIGKNLTVSVIGIEGFDGTVTSSLTIPTKAKGTTLLSPVLNEEANCTSISLKAYEGYEYKCNNGDWTASSVFENLSPNTEYSFCVRKVETATHSAGESSDIVSYRTKPVPLNATIVIDGSPEFGKTLTAVLADPGTATYTFQWYRNGTAIQGATGNKYITTVSDVDCNITVKAIASGTSVGEIESSPVKIICLHNVLSVETTKYASCTGSGIKTGTCVCGYIKTETIKPLGHLLSDYEIINEASCTQNGLQIAVCSRCEYSETKEIAAKGHIFNNGVCNECGDQQDNNCSCNCHKTGFMGIIWKILKFFYKLFGINKVCGCGVTHY